MNKKDHFLLWLLSLVIWGFLMPIRAYGFYWATIAHSIAFAILTWWTLHKFAPKAGFWRKRIRCSILYAIPKVSTFAHSL